MKYKVFVDGQEGATGLRIHDYLAAWTDLEVLRIDSDKRKDVQARHELINEADVVFLCLPDDAARESVSLVSNPNTRVIDASTAHRTDPGWVYGFPELNKSQRTIICESKRVTVPGCHATGFIAALYPLIQAGIVQADYPVTAYSVTGYSGGGRKVIAEYEAAEADGSLRSPRHYALGLSHKHLPEMQRWTGLAHPPLFAPIISSFARGMAVSIPLLTRLLPKGVGTDEVRRVLSAHYEGERFVRVMSAGEDDLENGRLDPEGCNDTNRLDIFVFGHADQIVVISRLDNLGKGASGAAVQNMNIMLGLDEGAGLRV